MMPGGPGPGGGGHLNKAKKYEGNVGILDQPMFANQKQKQYFSSLRAENARAVTGRRCPRAGWVKTF